MSVERPRDLIEGSGRLGKIEREIDDLGIREEVEREQAEYGTLTCGVVETPIGPISLLAARMLSSAPPLIGEYVTGRCYWVGESKVHVKPECRCKRR
jgi:hypothetical protein